MWLGQARDDSCDSPCRNVKGLYLFTTLRRMTAASFMECDAHARALVRNGSELRGEGRGNPTRFKLAPRGGGGMSASSREPNQGIALTRRRPAVGGDQSLGRREYESVRAPMAGRVDEEGEFVGYWDRKVPADDRA